MRRAYLGTWFTFDANQFGSELSSELQVIDADCILIVASTYALTKAQVWIRLLSSEAWIRWKLLVDPSIYADAKSFFPGSIQPKIIATDLTPILELLPATSGCDGVSCFLIASGHGIAGLPTEDDWDKCVTMLKG